MTNEQLQAIEKRVNAATPKPWFVYDDSVCQNIVRVNEQTKYLDRIGEGDLLTDAEFMAHAREDVSVMLNYIKELKGQLVKIDAILSRALGYPTDDNVEIALLLANEAEGRITELEGKLNEYER